jgi:hypothetical protein
MKVNETKPTHVTFTTRRATCPPVKINDVQLPQSDEVKYLGLHLDRRLTWHKHIVPRGNNSVLPPQKCICCSDESPNSPPPTNYYSIKPYSNPSGPVVYNSGALLPPPTLKFWNDSNLRSCAYSGCCVVSTTDPYSRILGFLDPSVCVCVYIYIYKM